MGELLACGWFGLRRAWRTSMLPREQVKLAERYRFRFETRSGKQHVHCLYCGAVETRSLDTPYEESFKEFCESTHLHPE